MDSKIKLPEYARALCDILLPPEVKTGAVQDFEYTFQSISEKNGKFVACCWFWFQIMQMIPSIINEMALRSISMFKNYLKIAFRNIIRNKTYSFLNLFGLSIGMAVFLLIFIYVQYELSFDKYHENSSSIYRIVQKQVDRKHYIKLHGTNVIAKTHAPVASALVDEFPEVISAVRIEFMSNILLAAGENKFFEDRICFADPSIFEIFSFKLKKGDPESALSDPNSIIISENMAKRYFHNEYPVGKVFRYNNSFDLKVTGVMENIPENSHFTMDFIIPFEKNNEIRYQSAAGWDHNWCCWTYFMLRRGVDIKGFEGKLVPLAEKASKIVGTRNDFLIQPLPSIHLNSHLFIEIEKNSDIRYVYILLTIAFLVLVTACLNYINLTTACSSKRSREVGIRKVVGAQKRQLIFQFFGESVFLTVLALIISAVIFFLALPFFNSLVGRNLSLDILNNSQIILLISVLIFLVGILAGSYPALFISSYKPVTVLKKNGGKRFKGISLRNILVTAQFSISIILIICTLVVKEQLYFINSKDIGYDKNRIVVLPLRDPELRRNLKVIKTELLKNPSIIKVSSSGSLPSSITSFKSIPASVVKERGAMYTTRIDCDFLDLFGIELIAGRNFSSEFPTDYNSSVIINETAAKILGLDSPVGQNFRLHNSRAKRKIIGVVKDFHFRSLHKKIDPLYLETYQGDSGYYLSIKIKGNQVAGTISLMKDQIEKISAAYPFNYFFFDENINTFYKSEQKTGDIFSIFAFIAVTIACLGLLGLSIFSAEQRKKEIAIRKTLGARIPGIIILVSRDFLLSMLCSVTIAWPAGYYAMNFWLKNFAYRIEIGLSVSLFACFMMFMTAVMTVIWSAVKSAIANPADSLRYE